MTFPGRHVAVHVTVDGVVELVLSVGDGSAPPAKAMLTPDHALWIAEQLQGASRLAARASLIGGLLLA